MQFLVAAHIKKRSVCTDAEKRDLKYVAMSACKFGCDELFERGYIAVADDGGLLLSQALTSCDEAHAYAQKYIAGKKFGRPMEGQH